MIVSLGQQLVLPGKFESVPNSSKLQEANLGVLQVAVGEARDTLMTQVLATISNSYYSTQSVTNV